MKIAIYPGTFDPITYGHIDIIQRSASIFDRVVVALAVNSNKQTMFTESERLALAVESLKGVTNVEVRSTSGLLVDFARNEGAIAIVRGMRAVSDFEIEMQMALMNRHLADDITTVFMMPNEKYTYLNSTIVRELARYHADVSKFVPACVARALSDKTA